MRKDFIGILDLIKRKAVPEPWAEGDNIPWSEPGFSERILAEHLSQAHDAASRRFEIIDKHAEFSILGGPAGDRRSYGAFRCVAGTYGFALSGG